MQEYRTKELYGDFYENEQKPLAVILGGSAPGIPNIGEELFEYLRLNFNVLLLAYFGVGPLPKTLERIQVEYFVNAIAMIQEEQSLNKEHLLLIGNSKGGEAVLVLTKYIKSAITIACVPGCYIFQGLPVRFSSMLFPKSSWSFQNQDMPFIKFSFNKKTLKDAKNKVYSGCYEESIKKNFKKEAIININRYKGRVLLLSAKNDKFWPSKSMCDNLVEKNRNANIEHYTLDLPGHYFLEYEQSGKEIIKFLLT